MPLRWQSKPKFDLPRPASDRLPAIYSHWLVFSQARSDVVYRQGNGLSLVVSTLL